MNLRRTRPAQPSPEMVDAVIDGYVAWREQSAAAGDAYRRWAKATQAEQATAFAAYVAALDREEWAAARYQWLVGRVSERRKGDERRGPASLDQAA